MADLFQKFDPTTVPEDEKGDFAPLPDGTYQARIVTSDEYENKKKTGRIIEFQWQIDGPTHAGRRLWQRINYIHQSETAQTIGQQDLKSITDGARKPHGIAKTEELHGIPMMIRVKLKDDGKGFGPQNVVGRAKPLSNPTPQTAKPQQSMSTEAGATEPDEGDEIPF